MINNDIEQDFSASNGTGNENITLTSYAFNIISTLLKTKLLQKRKQISETKIMP